MLYFCSISEIEYIALHMGHKICNIYNKNLKDTGLVRTLKALKAIQ